MARRVMRRAAAVLAAAAVVGCGGGKAESQPNPEFEVPKYERPSRSGPAAEASDPGQKGKDKGGKSGPAK